MSQPRPRIGISRWEDVPAERFADYCDRVQEAGGDPVELGRGGSTDGLDALVLTGGVDVAPERYGETPHPTVKRTEPARDTFETALLEAALSRDLPVLAICRGHQLLNVALGGSLLQDIPGAGHKWLEDGDSGWHEITLTGPGHVADAYPGQATLRVNSRHHQGITEDRLAPALRVTATSHDGYVEAADHTERRWVTGVQWHPERPESRAESMPLFKAFVDACGS